MVHARTLALASAACLAGSSALADDTKTEARKIAVDATTAYRAGHYADALKLYQRAYAMFPAAELLLDLSHAAMKAGDCDLAIASAHQLVAKLQDGTDTPLAPRAAEWRNMTEIDCPEVAISSAPPNASLWIDSESETPLATPWHGRLPAGVHTITLKQKGFADDRESVTVAAGQPTNKNVVFSTPSPQSPRVATTPPRAAPPHENAPSAPLKKAVIDDDQPAVVAVNPPATKRLDETTDGLVVATWVTLGIAAAGTVVASVLGSTVARCPTVVPTPNDAIAAYQCQTGYDTAANISWGLTGAAGITGGTLLAFWLPQSLAPEGGKVAFNFTPNSIGVAGRF